MQPRISTFISKTQKQFDMRKINPKDFTGYVIAGDGWSWAIDDFKRAVHEFSQITTHVTLYGQKITGEKAIIDRK